MESMVNESSRDEINRLRSLDPLPVPLSVETSAAIRKPISSGPAHSFADERRSGRRLAFLKRSGLFESSVAGVIVRRAASLTELRDAYELVHRVYVGTGYIRPIPSGLRLRVFEALPETATFVALDGDRVVGVLSIIGDSLEFGLPSDAAFRSELNLLRENAIRLCEASNQTVVEEYRKSSIPTELMRCAVAHMTKAGYDEVIATVSPSHSGFYQLLNFRQVGSVRSYSKDLDDPVVALCMDVNQYRRPADGLDEAGQFIHRFMAKENHFLNRVAGWTVEAGQLFRDSVLLRQLFVTQTDFLGQCTEFELEVLRHCWGKKLFGMVNERSAVAALQEWVTMVLCWLDTLEFHVFLPVPRRLVTN